VRHIIAPAQEYSGGADEDQSYRREMTCSAVTSWRGRPLTPTTADDSSGSVTATPILDWHAREVARLYDRVLLAPEAAATPTFLSPNRTHLRPARGAWRLRTR
jgi:hypothetical protein